MSNLTVPPPLISSRPLLSLPPKKGSEADKPLPLPDDNDTLNADDLHTLQLRHRLAAPTVELLRAIPARPDRRQVLDFACRAVEFRSFPMEPGERAFFRHLNDHSPVPYPVTPASAAITDPWHKAFLLVQADLLPGPWPAKLSAPARKGLLQQRGRIYKLLGHVLRCLVDLLGLRRDGRGVTVALDVLRSVSAGVWEGADHDLLQIPGIGSAKMGRLVHAGVKTVSQLSRLDFFHIERLLSRNPPFGHELLNQIAGFPLLTLQIEIIGRHDDATLATPASSPPRPPLLIVRVVLGYENAEAPSWKKKQPWTTLVVEGPGGELLWFWRGSVKRLVGGKEVVIGLEAVRGDELKVTFACEEVVGTIIRRSHRNMLKGSW